MALFGKSCSMPDRTSYFPAMRHGYKRQEEATPGGAATSPEEPRIAICVDDEESDLEALRDALASAGYQVKTALDGKTALQIFNAHAADGAILVTDIAMAPMSGTELAAEMVRLKPELRVVFVSGYSGSQAFPIKAYPLPILHSSRSPLPPRPCCRKSDLKPGKRWLRAAEGGCPTFKEACVSDGLTEVDRKCPHAPNAAPWRLNWKGLLSNICD